MASSTLGRETTPRRFCYLFEAKGIQRYIFDSGPLRDLIGASDLVAELARGQERRERDEAEAASALVSDIERDLIGRVLNALQIEAPSGRRAAGQVTFSRRASGAVMLHADDETSLHRIRALLRLTAGLRCPGLEMSDTRPVPAASDVEAVGKAYREASALRVNSGADLPPTGHPLTAFNPRTGRVATRLFPYQEDVVVTDGISEPHRLRADRLQGRIDGVAERYLGRNRKDGEGWEYVFPRNLDPEEKDERDNPLFPFEGEDRRIAVVHADLSGLGQIWRGFKDAAPADRMEAARAIEACVEGAAQEAVETILLTKAEARAYGDGAMIAVVPARPVVLGGDDLTILVRADLALPFAALLLERIEEPVTLQGEKRRLSACAGVAIVRAGQPFLMAYNLAESLCSFAKKAAKHNRPLAGPYPSMLAFHDALSTLREDYEKAILGREKTASGSLRLTGNPYLVGGLPGDEGRPARPRFEALTELAKALAADPRGLGKLIELAHRIADPAGESDCENWRRWRQVLHGRNRDALENVDRVLRDGFGIDPDNGAPPIATAPEGDDSRRYFPIADALELIDLKTVPVAEL
ncbi:MAG: Cas10/Cmr2 second palm domain-containing protein [Stellaceae bacterium]